MFPMMRCGDVRVRKDIEQNVEVDWWSHAEEARRRELRKRR